MSIAPNPCNASLRSAPDLLVVIAFGQKIGQELIQMPPHEAINVHASYFAQVAGRGAY